MGEVGEHRKLREVLRQPLASFARAVRTSLRYRLVLLTTLTLVLSSAVVGVSTYQAARVSLYDQLDLELLGIADQVAGQIAVDFQKETISNTASLDSENVLVLVVGANTNIGFIAGNADNNQHLTDFHETAIARIQVGTSQRNGENDLGVPFRIVAVPFTDATSGDAYALVIARDLTPTLGGLINLAALQWGISIAAILLCVVLAAFVAASTMNPIRDLTTQVADMTSTDELTTIEVHGASEVADLERSFNAMVESLRESRNQQNRLIADAGHELRTPLTSMRTNVELLIADESARMLPDGARAEILSDVAAQLGEFTSLISDLVALSRESIAQGNLIPLDFSEVVRRAIDRARRRGPSMVFDITLEARYVLGDAVLLERAITNLLDNAVKFSPPGGRITVRLDADGLTVTDEGPGIADADIPHIFERFYRSDSSRNTPGTGLGLSIVAHTIAAHSGTVTASRAASGGAKFTVHLPEIPPEEVGE